MNTNDSQSSDEEPTNANGRFTTMMPEKSKTEDDTSCVDCDDDAVSDARRSHFGGVADHC